MGAALKVHEAADLFPMMGSDDYAALKESIRKSGMLEPISVLADGTLLDGRNRLRACEDLGLPARTVTVQTDDPVAFVWAKNGARRQLTAGQRAAIAAKAMPMLQAQAKERLHAAQERGRATQVGRTMEKVPESNSSGNARDQAAALVKVNAQYVQRATQIRRNHPDLFAKLESGEISMQEARDASAERGAPRRLPEDPVPTPAPPKPMGKKAQINHAARFQRANEWLGFVESVPGYVSKLEIHIDVIRGNESLRRSWIDACREVSQALKRLARKLSGEA